MALSDALVVFVDEPTSRSQIFTQLISEAGAIGFTSTARQVSSHLGGVFFEQPTCCTDLAGGWFIAWWERGTASNDWKLKLVRHDSTGTASWSPVTVATCAESGGPTDSWPKVTPDREGGCFITWDNEAAGVYSCHVNRYTSAGAVASGWAATRLHAAVQVRCGYVSYPLVPGDGHVYVTYLNPHNSNFGTATAWVHKFAIGSPAPLWGVNGVQVGPSGTFFDWGRMFVSDGQGGLIVPLNDSGARLRRISSSGATVWTTPVLSSSSTSGAAACVSDGAGGAIVEWVDSALTIKAQRVSQDGLSLWASPVTLQSGVISNSPDTNHLGVSDGSNGAIFLWAGDAFTPHVYVCRVDKDGNKTWGANPIAPAFDPVKQQLDQWIATDANGGCIVSWAESVSGSQYDAYAMRINAAGATVWGPVALRSSATRQNATLVMYTNAPFADIPIVIAPPAATDSRAGLESNIRLLIDDRDKDHYAISSVRMVQLMNGAMHTLANRVFMEDEALATVNLLAGTYDYTLTGIVGAVRGVFLSTGMELERMEWDQMVRLYRQDTSLPIGTGIPSYYALIETSGQASKIRVAPTPATIGAVPLKVRYSIIPSALTLETSTVPFSEPLLRAFERMVASQCLAVMHPEDRARRMLGIEQMKEWAGYVDEAVREENWRVRVASGATQGDIVWTEV